MTVSSALLNELPIIAAAIVTPVAIHLLLALSKLQKPRAEGDLLIFPVSWFSKAIGLTVAVGSGTAAYFSARAKDADLWTYLFLCCMGLIGIWMSVGEFRLSNSCIEKRILWVRKALLWNQIREIDESSGGSTLYGESMKLWVEPFCAGYARLLEEIHERVPHLKVREKPKWKKRLGW